VLGRLRERHLSRDSWGLAQEMPAGSLVLAAQLVISFDP
jgi:hypothetical protein